LVVDHRHVEIGIEEEKRAVKIARSDSNDSEWVFVQPHDPANYSAIAGEAIAPVIVREHDIGCAVRPMLVARVKYPAEIRLDAERIEVVSAERLGPGPRRIVARIDTGLRKGVRHKTFEAAVAVAQVEIVGVRLSTVVLVGALDAVEAFGARHIDR